MSDVTTRALEILQRLGAGNPFDAVPEGAQRDLPATSPIDGHEIQCVVAAISRGTRS